MLRHVAAFMIVLIAASSGRLLMCQWDCAHAMTQQPACHESKAALSIDAASDICQPDASLPAVATVKVVAPGVAATVLTVTTVASIRLSPPIAFATAHAVPSSTSIALGTTVLRV